MSVQTELLGCYLSAPDDGDAGWVRAVWVQGGELKVLLERDNVSHDFRTYYANNLVLDTRAR